MPLAAVIVLFILVVWAFLHMFGMTKSGKGGSTLASLLGWFIRSVWALLVWMWTSPGVRLVLALGFLTAVVLWLWWPLFFGAYGLVWSGIVVAVAAVLWAAAAGAVHHTSPAWWRGLAIARTAGYAILSGPLALALGDAVTQGVWGTLLGVLAWCLIAGGLVAHLLTGSEYKQAPQQ